MMTEQDNKIEYTEFQEAVRHELNEYLKSSQTTISKIEPYIAKYKANTIGQFLAGTYTGNVQNVAEKVKEFLENESERRLNVVIDDFYDDTMQISWRAREVLRYCHLQRKLGVITGRPQLGKTATALWYKRKYSNVILIRADVGYTPTTIYEDICEHLGLEVDKIQVMRKKIVDVITKEKVFIIADEVENIPFRSLDALRILRDKTDIGMVWQGQEWFGERLGSADQRYKQIARRVAYYAKLHKHLTEDDVRTFLLHIFPNTGDVEKFAPVFHQKCYWSVARVKEMAEFCLRLMRSAKVNSLNYDIIEQAEDRMLKEFVEAYEPPDEE